MHWHNIFINETKNKFIMIKKIFFILVVFQLTACAELSQLGTDLLSSESPLTNAEAGRGLKEALKKGVMTGVSLVSKRDGYFKNPLIKIPFPTEAQKVKNTLDQIPGGSLLTANVVEKINRGAEDAAKGAGKIFGNAITNMSFSDVMGILMGEKNAATQYFKSTTTKKLFNSFNPVIKTSLSKVKALDAWSRVITKYNTLPLVKKVNPSMDGFVTNKAIDGLFVMIEKEELAIRKNPAERTTDLMKKVFAKQD